MTDLAPPESATRIRLMDAAARLFYSQGVHVGVAALCEEAGVSKRSMYQHFDSKDEVIAAALARSIPGYLESLYAPATEPGRQRIIGLFHNVEQLAGSPSFRGCPYVSVASEVKNPDHPAIAVVRDFHRQLAEYLRAAAAEAGATDPELLSRELTLVHDGAMARAVVHGTSLDGLAVIMATTLLDAAGTMESAA